MKRCSKCGETKDAGAFYQKRASRDGLYCQCKICAAEYRRASYEKNRGVVKARSLAYYEANRGAVLARMMAYRNANRESLAEQKRAYRWKTRESGANRAIAYRKANHEVIADRARARNAATLAAASHTKLPWTPSEESVVTLDDVSIVEKAFMLRRTNAAVVKRAHILRNRAAVSA